MSAPSKPLPPELALNPELEAESEAPKPKRELYTPKPKQAKVIKRHFNGESDHKIHREEKIDRATIARILAQPEVVAVRARLQSYAEGLGFKALVVVEATLDSDYPQLAFAAATKHLEGIGVYDKRGLQGIIDDAKARHMKSTDEIVQCACGPGAFPWPPLEPPSQPETKKRARRKPPESEVLDEPSDDPGSEDNGSSST